MFVLTIEGKEIILKEKEGAYLMAGELPDDIKRVANEFTHFWAIQHEMGCYYGITEEGRSVAIEDYKNVLSKLINQVGISIKVFPPRPLEIIHESIFIIKGRGEIWPTFFNKINAAKEICNKLNESYTQSDYSIEILERHEI